MTKPYGPTEERVRLALLRVVSKVNVWVFRRTGGRKGGTLRKLGGAPVCLLTTTGVRTGKARTVALPFLRDGDDIVVVASSWGMARHPHWYGNLTADPKVSVELAGGTAAMIARTATPDEKARLWPRLLEMHAGYADYQARTDREIPVVICTPASA